MNTNRLLSSVREYLTPLLPPPVIALIKRIDSDVTAIDILGSDPAMKILIASVILLIMVKLNLATSTNKGRNKKSRKKTVVDMDTSIEESVLTASAMATLQDKYGDTVILIGPSQSGKTFLFHKLIMSTCQIENCMESIPQSVVSLRANVEILPLSQHAVIRLIDYPGHVQLLNQLGSLLIPPMTKTSHASFTTTRIVLVIDATKSVHEAANLIYKYLFSDTTFFKVWQQRQRSNEKDILKILVVCNKSDEKDAKNWRRIKLQLKAELDHLQNLSMQILTDGHNMERKGITVDRTIAEMLDQTINLDELGPDIPMEFHFLSLSGSSTMEDTSFKALRAFVENGEIIEKNSPIMKQR